MQVEVKIDLWAWLIEKFDDNGPQQHGQIYPNFYLRGDEAISDEPNDHKCCACDT